MRIRYQEKTVVSRVSHMRYIEIYPMTGKSQPCERMHAEQAERHLCGIVYDKIRKTGTVNVPSALYRVDGPHLRILVTRLHMYMTLF
jgi:hypothetical protein